MGDYLIFGGCLRSELSLPELPRLDGVAPTWTLRMSAERPPASILEKLGETEVGGGPACVYRTPSGVRLDYHDTGCFDVSADGSEIVWTPLPDASLQSARLDVMGRVLAMAMHVAGSLTLHGSAVAVGRRAVVFLAPKFHGKSTLAMALVHAGGRLITDDVLPVAPGSPPVARPGVHRVRLWTDSASYLVGSEDARVLAEQRGKHLVDTLPDECLMVEGVPIGAIYLLNPLAPDAAAEPVRREQLPAVQAALSVVRHARMGELLGGREAAVVFERAVEIARHVPVFRLDIVRDFERLGPVTSRLLRWHQEPAPSRADPALVG